MLQTAYNQIWQDSIWDLIYFLALFMIWFQWKQWKRGAQAFGWSVFLILLLMFNPITAYLTIGRIYAGSTEYARHAWLFFIIPVIAYVSVNMILRFQKRWKTILVCIILFLLFISQSPSLSFYYQIPENRYKIPDEIIEFSELIHKETGAYGPGQIRILVQRGGEYAITEPDSGDGLYYGLRMLSTDFEIYPLFTEEGQQGEVPEVIKDGTLGGQDYLACRKWPELEKAAEEAGLRKIGETDNYVAYAYARNVYQITQYPQANGAQGMCYTITDKEGHLVIIDGGWEANSELLLHLIADHGGHVDAWIITHPHQDHVQAFENLMMGGFDITIDHIYAVDLDYDYYESVANEYDGGFEFYQDFLECTEGMDELTYVHAGDVIDLIGIEMTVLNAYEPDNDNYLVDPANNGSMVFRLKGTEKSMLFLADTKAEMAKQIAEKMRELFGDDLEVDYCQMSHHGGVGSMPDDFYKIVDPWVAFMDMPVAYTLDENTEAYQHRKLMESLGATIYAFDENSPHSVTLR